MIEPIFFELPIYRCKLSSHSKEMKALEEKLTSEIQKEISPESYRGMKDHFHSTYWYPWKYNEIIGFLNLYILGNQFRGDIWFINKMRINKGIIKKKFIYRSKAFETQIPRQKTSDEIFQFMLAVIKNLQKKEFKRFHFDLKTFIVIGQFVDWVELTEKLNSYTYPKHRRKYFEDL